ncbi:ParB/RepB/Spo0J family partition protein, partial [Burkholderia alba]|uniref:ParB/RepB/Spo0J family partition protein n=1 Tax=Burkholderia alba TaxID=2683677 RepID=UPI002B060DB0
MSKSKHEPAVGVVAIDVIERVQYIPYDRLRLSPHNARRKPPTGIQELADDIDAHDVLQNLVAHVMPNSSPDTPLYGVCAGQRRWLAVGALVASGRKPSGYLMPVLVRSEGEALALSLLENQHEGMHIADQCEAFKRLVAEGGTVASIAIRFKTSEKNVQRALKLASVSPKLLDLFRDDGMKYEQVCALALTDDHDMQERLWFDAKSDWQRAPGQIKATITQAEIS